MSQIEHYCFEEHEEIRRAAVECLCNMLVNEEVSKVELIIFTKDALHHRNSCNYQFLRLCHAFVFCFNLFSMLYYVLPLLSNFNFTGLFSCLP